MNEFNSQVNQPLIIKEDHIMMRSHVGSVQVEFGVLLIQGDVTGSLKIHKGAVAIISGKHTGSVHIAEGAELQVNGMHTGSIHVKQGGKVIVDLNGKLAGTLHNDGEVIVKGVFGGKRLGEGSFILDGGTIKQPKIKDGVATYIWD